MSSGVYQIRNQLNGKRYIGSASNIRKRWQNHLSALRRDQHRNRHLQRAFNKYGAAAFVFSVLESVAQLRLIEREQDYLDRLRPQYNIAPMARSPMLGRHHTPETCSKLSEALKGKPNPHQGHPHSKKTRRKIGEAQMGERGYWYGKRLSEEHRRKMSEAHSGQRNHNYGKRFTQEHRRNMSIAQKERWRRVHAASAAPATWQHLDDEPL